VWLKYASWEISQKDFDRARSVFERALDVDYRNQVLWLKYAEMEMKNKFINYARNLWDRAVQLMPRVDQFWYKFAYMEEMLGNIGGARQIFERWMDWEPDHNAWYSYVKMELRHKNVDRARNVLERFVVCHNEVASYLRLAKFEEKYGNPALARKAYERAVSELGAEGEDPTLFVAFANFEIRCKEYERARAIFKYALDHVPKSKAEDLYKMYTGFEKQHGDRSGVEDVILSKKRFQYEEEIKSNPLNYDLWFDYIRLEESGNDKTKIREVYERAIANVPPIQEKRYWKRYIYLWINFALYEELEAKDVDRAAAVMDKCLELIPHKLFSFANLWMMRAHLEIRRKQVEAARKILGTAIGKCGQEAVFKGYIEIELQLGNIDRCRKIYEKYLSLMPHNCQAWIKFAELESGLSELARARRIFELAIAQPVLDQPEQLWKAYIDLEISQKAYDSVRKLYGRLLERTKHVKVWISQAQFEATIGHVANARPLFTQADNFFKQEQKKEERVMLLEAWRDFEIKHGDQESATAVAKKLPRKIKKKRQLKAEDGSDLGWEEYFDYIFPDEEDKQANLKILERARQWKKQKVDA
jgi:crooked neck